MNETSRELLLTVSRAAPGTLGAQIEDQLRRAIRDGALRPGAQLPSTRDLAAQLAVSRRIVVDAYAQLAAEGYLVLRQGARPRVSDNTATTTAEAQAPPTAPPPRHDFRPSTPDVSHFPRSAWLRALRQAVTTISDADLGYGDPRGMLALRIALADYLGRVRGVVAVPERVIATSGYWQGVGIVARALKASGATRVAVEDPALSETCDIVEGAGLQVVLVDTDDEGIRVDALARAGADAVILTPAHKDPTGAVLSAARRTQLIAWLRARKALAIEDDYDAEYRYDRAGIGALQGLDPDRVVYAGSVSKTLAPALRIGWLVIPAPLLDAVTHEKTLADHGSPRIDQLALADFLARGDLDRHLRRMRSEYAARRDALVAALAAELPEATVRGVAAGLHVTVELPPPLDAEAVAAVALEQRIAVKTLGEYRTRTPRRATLLVGYGQLATPAILPGVRALAAAVRSAAG